MAGIYLHIPFCKTRCVYCDFFSTTHSELKIKYTSALCRELEMRKNDTKEEKIETVYFGGGTPSQLSVADFEKLFETIRHTYGLEEAKEITLEANPDDLTPAYLQQLSNLPFNRLSIGIQTFNDKTLTFLHRRHSAAQAIEAVGNARKAGFNNISIDLMYGLPGQTLENWKADLQQAISLDPEHISAYHLIYEQGTPLYNMLQSNKIKEVDEESSLLFFTTLIDELTKAGYEHYEISNFCKPGKHSQHNTSYWQGITYLGCGASAHSYSEKRREWNASSIQKYIEGIEKGERAFEAEELDKSTQYNELIITSLRTQWGVSIERIEHEFGKEYLDYFLNNIQKHIDSGTVKIEQKQFILTRSGIFVSDNIMSDLLWVTD